MTTFYDGYWTALKTVILGAWPEIDGKLSQDTAIERRDWYNDLNEGTLTVPWCVVKLEIAPTTEWSALPTDIITATVWYITSLDAAKAQSVTATSWITDKLIALQAALYDAQTLGTVLDQVALSINADDPINVSFLDQKNNYQAGSLQVQTVVVLT